MGLIFPIGGRALVSPLSLFLCVYLHLFPFRKKKKKVYLFRGKEEFLKCFGIKCQGMNWQKERRKKKIRKKKISKGESLNVIKYVWKLLLKRKCVWETRQEERKKKKCGS